MAFEDLRTEWPEPLCLYCDERETIPHFTITDAVRFLLIRYPLNIASMSDDSREAATVHRGGSAPAG